MGYITQAKRINGMATKYTAKTETQKDGEWDAITANFLDYLGEKDPDFIKGFLDGIAYRFKVER
jgi:hypothetical protein